MATTKQLLTQQQIEKKYRTKPQIAKEPTREEIITYNFGAESPETQYIKRKSLKGKDKTYGTYKPIEYKRNNKGEVVEIRYYQLVTDKNDNYRFKEPRLKKVVKINGEKYSKEKFVSKKTQKYYEELNKWHEQNKQKKGINKYNNTYADKYYNKLKEAQYNTSHAIATERIKQDLGLTLHNIKKSRKQNATNNQNNFSANANFSSTSGNNYLYTYDTNTTQPTTKVKPQDIINFSNTVNLLKNNYHKFAHYYKGKLQETTTYRTGKYIFSEKMVDDNKKFHETLYGGEWIKEIKPTAKTVMYTYFTPDGTAKIREYWIKEGGNTVKTIVADPIGSTIIIANDAVAFWGAGKTLEKAEDLITATKLNKKPSNLYIEETPNGLVYAKNTDEALDMFKKGQTKEGTYVEHTSPSTDLARATEISTKGRQLTKGKAPKPEDPVLFVSPKGKGQTLFYYLGEGGEYKFTLNPFARNRPTHYRGLVDNVQPFPKEVLDQATKGYTANGKRIIDWNKINEFYEQNKGTYITARRTAGHTREAEAGISYGTPYKVKEPQYYIQYEGRNIPIYELDFRQTSIPSNAKIPRLNQQVYDQISSSYKNYNYIRTPIPYNLYSTVDSNYYNSYKNQMNNYYPTYEPQKPITYTPYENYKQKEYITYTPYNQQYKTTYYPPTKRTYPKTYPLKYPIHTPTKKPTPTNTTTTKPKTTDTEQTAYYAIIDGKTTTLPYETYEQALAEAQDITDNTPTTHIQIKTIQVHKGEAKTSQKKTRNYKYKQIHKNTYIEKNKYRNDKEQKSILSIYKKRRRVASL